MPLILPGSAPAPDPGYQIANSCRFNDGDSSYVHKAFGTPTDNDKWTLSMWIKRGVIGALQNLMGCWVDGDHHTILRINATDQLDWYDWDNPTAPKLVTNRVFRDPSAWYHIVIVYDSGNGTEGNRMQTWVNGVRETSFATDNYPDADRTPLMNTSGNTVEIARRYDGGYFDGYMAEVVFIDGLALTPASFGEFNSDSPTIWQPIDVSGLTFGTNGFYLDFEDSANLGNDANGGTDLTEVNLDATDQCTDTPTNNFCTLNPSEKAITNYETNTFSEGNLKITDGSSYYLLSQSTFAVTAGKWYWETFIDATTSNTVSGTGIADVDGFDRSDGAANGAFGWIYAPDGDTRNAGTSTAYGDTYAADDVIGIALDMDNLAIYFSKNGVWQASGDPESGASKTNAAYTNLTGTVAAHVYDGHGDQAHEFTLNFGNPPYANISDAADANGYGAFEYAPPSGYLALCTKNLGSDGG